MLEPVAQRSFFGDLRWVPLKREALQASSIQEQFLCEIGAQLCSYLVYRYILAEGQCTKKEIDQNYLFVIWQCSKFSCLRLLTFEVQITRVPRNYFLKSALSQGLPPLSMYGASCVLGEFRC